MIKSIVVAHRKAGLSAAEFNRYWKDEHGPLAARIMPNVRRYVQNHFIPLPGVTYEGDGIVEMWYDDLSAYRETMDYLRSDAARELAEDGAKFCDLTHAREWVVEEHVIK